MLKHLFHQGSDIELVNWQRLAGVWGVRVFTKDGELHRLVGSSCIAFVMYTIQLAMRLS